MRKLHLTLTAAGIAASLLLAGSGALPSVAAAAVAEQPSRQWWPEPYGYPASGYGTPFGWGSGPLVYVGTDFASPYAGSPGYPYYRYGAYYGTGYGVPYYVSPAYSGSFSGSVGYAGDPFGYLPPRCIYPASAGYGGGYGSPFDPYGYGVYAPYC